MKKFFTLVVLALLAVGCAKEYDDTGLRELIAGLDLRVSELESSVSALQSTLGDGKFVRKVEEFKDPDTGRTTGVTVTYTDGNIVHFNIVPTDPSAGPVFSVIRNGAGELVWAVDGITIKVDGEDVPVYQTPVFSIDEEGNLWVEVDGRKTDLGPVKSEGATLQDGIFTNLAVTDGAVVLTLSDGTTVNIPFAEAFKLNIEATEFTFGSLEPIEIPYTVSAKTGATVVGVAGYSPKEFSVEVTAEKIVVTPLRKDAAAVMMAYADSEVGLVSIVNLTFEAEGFEITDAPYSAEYDYLAQGEDAVVVANAVSNIPFEVKPVEDWIHVASVKSTAYVITLKLDDNLTGEVREGTVNIVKAGTEEVIQTIKVVQLAAVIDEGPKNLSKKGAANSYIVTEAGQYKFWAVKGNSGEAVSPATVEVLWETWNNTEEVTPNSVIASVSIAGSYVVFSTPETLKPGNAVIAAKDAAGVILWSWHIWVPATEVKTIANGIYSAPMMDRNLGALVVATADDAIAVESFGLTYQWGRKDPFVGVGTIGEESNATVAGEAITVTEGAGEADESKITLEQSIQNPTLYGHTKNKGWLLTVDNTLWQNDVKTMYDPCPPGYRVPARDKTQPFHSDDLSAAAGWAEASNWFTLGDPAAVFPLAGYRDDYSPKKVCHAYDRAVYWTAYASAEDGGTAYYVNVRKGSAHKLAEAGKSRAGSVRCVAADEEAILPPYEPTEPTEPTGSVVDLSKDASANSYLVTAAGDYKFKAVKGNSAESVGAVAKAEIVWETDNTATAPEVNAIIAKVGFADGYVTFSTPAALKPGNALIAVKDASDAILWSWHVWIPATEVKVWDSEALCGAKMMDRNLGALVDTGASGDVDPLSIGLYYQWGRKDPFPGATSFEKSPHGAAVAGTDWTYHQELITTAYSVAHPTEYASVPEVDDGVWNAEDPQDLWNAGDKKTIYDPCPPGYRVPLYDKSLPLWAGSDEGFTYDGSRVSYGDFHFTVAGYIDCWSAGYAYSNLRTHVWASKWYDEKRGTCAYFRLDKDPKYYAQKYHKAKAGSVRCVVE
jgi:hypothetical protein